MSEEGNTVLEKFSVPRKIVSAAWTLFKSVVMLPLVFSGKDSLKDMYGTFNSSFNSGWENIGEFLRSSGITDNASILPILCIPVFAFLGFRSAKNTCKILSCNSINISDDEKKEIKRSKIEESIKLWGGLALLVGGLVAMNFVNPLTPAIIAALGFTLLASQLSGRFIGNKWNIIDEFNKHGLV